jgi:hypothetical protein
MGAMWPKRGARLEDEMPECRRSVRQNSKLRGRIYFKDGRTSVSCPDSRHFYEGARIVIFDPVEIPNKIKLCIPEKNRIMGATHGVGADGDRPAPLRRSAVKREAEEDGR